MTIKAVVAEFLDQVATVGPKELAELERLVGAKTGKSASRRYLIDLLLATDVVMDSSIGGFDADLRGRVRTRDLESAAASLTEMAVEYEQARESSNTRRAEDCRRAVRHAKERLLLSLGRKGLSGEKRKEKEELRRWLVVWLETPEIFPDWIELRRNLQRGAGEPTSPV